MRHSLVQEVIGMAPLEHEITDLLDAEEISPEQERAMLDRGARCIFGIDADEFERRWRAGHYRNCDDPRVTDLAFYLH